MQSGIMMAESKKIVSHNTVTIFLSILFSGKVSKGKHAKESYQKVCLFTLLRKRPHAARTGNTRNRLAEAYADGDGG